MLHTGSTTAVPFVETNAKSLLQKYQQLGATATLISTRLDEVEEKAGYAFYCDKCDHIDMKRSDFIRHKIVHITPIADHFVSSISDEANQEPLAAKNVSNDLEAKHKKDNGGNTTKDDKISALHQEADLSRSKSATNLTEKSSKDDSERNVVNTGTSTGKQNKKKELKDGEGLMKRYKLSNDMAEIIGQTPGGITRHECLKQLWKYLKDNNLQDERYRQFFVPDAKMGKVFGFDRLRSFSMTKYISQHLLPLDVSDLKISDEPNLIQSDFSEIENLSPPLTNDDTNEPFKLMDNTNSVRNSDAPSVENTVEIISDDELDEVKQVDLFGEKSKEVLPEPQDIDSTINRDDLSLDEEDIMDWNKPEKVSQPGEEWSGMMDLPLF